MACPKGKVPSITAYSGMDCSGTAVSAGTLPAGTATGDPGACTDIVIKSANGGVTVGGRSAKFVCE